MSTATLAPTYVRQHTYIPPLSIDLDRIRASYALAYRLRQRGQTSQARDLAWEADRHLRLVESRIDQLRSDDPVNNRELLNERCEVMRQSRRTLLAFVDEGH